MKSRMCGERLIVWELILLRQKHYGGLEVERREGAKTEGGRGQETWGILTTDGTGWTRMESNRGQGSRAEPNLFELSVLPFVSNHRVGAKWICPEDALAMKLVMPQLDLAPGKFICLHIPHGLDGDVEALERDLPQLASRQGRKAAISKPAEIWPAGVEFFLKQRSTEWLAHTAGISEDESGQVIAGLGVRVAEKLANNAGTPRCLLGIAAKLISKPEVVVYSDAGLDVEGCRTVHRFVAAKCSHVCFVHVSYPAVFGDGSPHPRICPPGVQCVAPAFEGSGPNR